MHLFIQNKYTKWYYEIVNNAKEQNRSKGREIYYERHHIIPKCMGGSNKKDNLVLLTAREHYVCHALLCKMCMDEQHRYKMLWAFKRTVEGNKPLRKYMNSRLYEFMRLKFVEIHSKIMSGENHPMHGTKHSDKSREIMSETKSRWWLITSPDGISGCYKNLTVFCKENKLNQAHMWSVANGNKRNQHKGWKCTKIP